MYHFLKGKVKVVKVCGRYCVDMPLFKPIEKNDQVGMLEEVNRRSGKLLQDEKKIF